jgi:hypothetical protein
MSAAREFGVAWMAATLSNLWRGELPLGVTFWVYGVGVTVVITIAHVMLASLLGVPIESTRHSVVALVAIAGMLWRIFTWIAIWRSADNYNGPRHWRILAKVSVIISLAEWALQLAGRA